MMGKLTHEQIDAMGAGREMDALVAELVMRERFATLSWDDIPEFGITAGEATGEPLPYSTDIASAWQVVEKMISNNKFRILFEDADLWAMTASEAAEAISLIALTAVMDG